MGTIYFVNLNLIYSNPFFEKNSKNLKKSESSKRLTKSFTIRTTKLSQ